MNQTHRVLMLALASMAVGAAAAQAPPPAPAAPVAAPSKPLSTSLGLVVFPAKGQTPTKQSGDEGECYAWSKGQTGVDPFAPPPAATLLPHPRPLLRRRKARAPRAH